MSDGLVGARVCPQLINMKALATTAESVSKLARAASHVRVGIERAKALTGFMAVFAASMSGYSGLGVWAIAITAVALFFVSFSENAGLHKRAMAQGATAASHGTLLRSAGNALGASTAAYLTGFLLRLL